MIESGSHGASRKRWTLWVCLTPPSAMLQDQISLNGEETEILIGPLRAAL